jgi:Protein of unknown function (DUF2637)
VVEGDGMKYDKLLRVLTVLAVITVAAIAATISYSHIYDLGLLHGQHGFAASLLPLSVDGSILAASMVLLREARVGASTPKLAQAMLVLGITATLGANVSYGIGFGALGAVISAWPAIAFIGSAEITLGMVRRARTSDTTPAVPDVPALVPVPVPRSGGGSHARTRGTSSAVTNADAEVRFTDHLTMGRVPTIRQIRDELKVGQDKAQQLKTHLQSVLDSNDGQPVPLHLLPDTPTGTHAEMSDALRGGGFG